jgi:cytoskeletal protein RodZ
MNETRQITIQKGYKGSSMPSFGEYLKRERELREISLREISDETKISYRYLEALEEDNTAKLPAEVFVKGFIRSYAGYIGLDADEAILRYQEYEKTKDITGQSPKVAADQQSTNIEVLKKFPWIWVLVALLTAGFVFFYAYGYWKKGGGQPVPQDSLYQDIEKSVPPPPEPVLEKEEVIPDSPEEIIPEPPPPPPEPPVQEEEKPSPLPLRITLSAQEQTWLAVDVDSKQNYDITLQPGEEIHFSMEETMRLTIGNAGGLLIRTNGRTFGPLGESGQVVKNFLLTRKDLQEEPPE